MRAMMPSVWRRVLCRVLGHRWLLGGVTGLLEFPVCVRCGRWSR